MRSPSRRPLPPRPRPRLHPPRRLHPRLRAPPPTATFAPLPPPVVTEPPPVVTEPAPAKPPKTLEVGSGEGSCAPGALLQFWAYGSHQVQRVGDEPPVADEDTLTLRLRRAELRVKGDIVPKRIGFQIMIDPARALEVSNRRLTTSDGATVTVAQPPSDSSGNPNALTILQDFFITFRSDFVDISVGQFKIPVSLEGYGSSSKILFPERAPVSRRFGDRRDMGVRLEKKLGEYFGYSAGVFNGSGQNKLDDDTEKDVALRLEAYPFEGVTVAGVGYATVGKRKKSSRDRLEADLRYDAHSIYVLAEYIHAWDTTGGAKAVKGHGGYVAAAYTFFNHLQPMLRVGDLEPNTEVSGDHYWHYEAGLNWLFQKYEAKIGLAFAYYDPTNPTPPRNPKRTEGILAVQAAF